MVDFKKLGQQAKTLVDKRGGTEAVKEDAEQLRAIARGKGSLADKAKAAAEALKTPGAEAEKAPVADTSTDRSPAPPTGDSDDAPDPQEQPERHADRDRSDADRTERKAERRAERAERAEGE